MSFSTAARTRVGGHGSGRSAAPSPQQRALTVHVDTCLFYSSHVESLPFRDAHRCYGVQAALSCGCRLVSQMLMLLHDCFKRELRMSMLTWLRAKFVSGVHVDVHVAGPRGQVCRFRPDLRQTLKTVDGASTGSHRDARRADKCPKPTPTNTAYWRVVADF